MSANNLFDEFPAVSKTAWLEQVAKDLKGKALEELNWQLPDGLIVSPLVHADDFQTLPSPVFPQPNRWEICEEIQVSDVVSANRLALEALEAGAESLCFWLARALSAEEFDHLLAGIHLDFIGLHFDGVGVSENPGALLGQLESLAKRRSVPTAKLRGSLAYDPVPNAKIVDWRYLADLLGYAKETFPQFALVRVNENSDNDLSQLLLRANIYLKKLSERGVPVADTVHAMQFSVSLGKYYFYEIARLRALQILWFNLLEAWAKPVRNALVSARFRPEAYTDDLYTNMIRATTMAMSAALGGANRLSVLPYDTGREAQAVYSQAFSRRIARNVQHLLKMESSLDEIPDPAAGSFYLETLTRQLAEQAWEKFVQTSPTKNLP